MRKRLRVDLAVRIAMQASKRAHQDENRKSKKKEEWALPADNYL